MKIGVVGTGYVGLVTGTCLAEAGNDVTCVDVDAEKVARMQSGEVPIYEPGLDKLLSRNMKEGRLHFTTELSEAVSGAAAVFLCLPTPQSERDGSADLSYVLKAAIDIGGLLTDYTVIVNKSTVPIGTARKVRSIIAAVTNVDVDVASNPETLREGQAVKDFLNPQQVIIGTDSPKARKVLRDLYRPFVVRDPSCLRFMDCESAEMAKYAINAALALKISYANQVAELCRASGADYEHVRGVLGSDNRIGDQFLFTGPGWGGSCFPKDSRAIVSMGEEFGVYLSTVQAAITGNERQKLLVPSYVRDFFGGDVTGKKLALWGLAFKDNTDDVRESPAITIARTLAGEGARITAFDPQATENARKLLGDEPNVSYTDDQYDALRGADALIIATNWKEFCNPDPSKMMRLLGSPLVFDGRNVLDPVVMEEAGFYYSRLGRRPVDGRRKV